MDIGKEITQGQTLSLDKGAFTANKYYIGMGWDMANANAPKVDCDLFAVELGPDGKWDGNFDSIAFYPIPGKKDYTNNKTNSAKTGADNRDGAGDGDDESVLIDLDKVDPNSGGLAVCINIYDGATKGQKFGDINNLFARLVRGDSGDGEAVAGFKLNPSKIAPAATALEYVRFVRNNGVWNYEGRGKPLGTPQDGSRIDSAAKQLA